MQSFFSTAPYLKVGLFEGAIEISFFNGNKSAEFGYVTVPPKWYCHSSLFKKDFGHLRAKAITGSLPRAHSGLVNTN